MRSKHYNPEESQLYKEKYGWTKYGEGNKGLYQGEVPEEWNCQACGEPQPSELSPYKFEFVSREYIRICAKCYAKVHADHITSFTVLVRIVRIERL